MTLVPVILSGGSGSRLWPLSREHYPKQLLSLLSNYTLLQETVLRLEGLPDLSPPLIVCNKNHRFLVAEQIRALGIKPFSIILEPIGRNTAPAVAAAALAVRERNPNAFLLVLPADHVILDRAAFHQAIMTAVNLAEHNYLATFGIVPTRPETGYGYIKAGEVLPDLGGFQVAEFVEKPSLETAISYTQSRQYYWNSGMFLFRAKRYLEELGQFESEILQACEQSFEQVSLDLEEDFIRLDENSFAASPSNSIDYAVMEKTQDAAVVPLAAGWSDIGAWSALWEISAQDKEGNVKLGDVLSEKTKNCYLRADFRLLATLGVENLVIVETADAVLVAHRDHVQQVKTIVSRLKETQRGEADLHRKVYRPWGTFETLEQGERFKVKRITVKPGASLSFQMHYHRSEHWIVVKGTARIVRDDDETFILSENQSTYIPLGIKHRLENPGKVPLEIIEVQSGAYLGEDDIVRFDDHYGREENET